MPKRLTKQTMRTRMLATAPYSADYLARKHNISRDHARGLIREIGHDRQMLNEAAGKLSERVRIITGL
jgi:hypothetical protein